MDIAERTEFIDLSESEHSFFILHLSDFHILWSDKKLTEIASRIRALGPDLVVMTGDYFDTPKGASLFRIFLQEIATTFKVIFIRGNHDFVYGKSVSDQLMNIPNCTCVEKEVFEHKAENGQQYRITSWQNKAALGEEEGVKNMVLMHNPEHIKETELKGIDVILAGHLHGGQFIFWKNANGSFFPASFLYKYCTDRRQLNQTTLIVSKGLGDTLPLRYRCPHEIVKVIMR